MTQYGDKYSELIDEDTWDFIHKTNASYPADTVVASIAKQRELYDAMCEIFYAGRPHGVKVSDGEICQNDVVIKYRKYTTANQNPNACVVYAHGGGFVVGGLHSHDDICAEICIGANVHVLSIDYRLSPEHPHPAAFKDMLAGFEFAAECFGLPVIVAGDSAGACLASAVCHVARQNSIRPVGQVLIYPTLGGDMSVGSYIEHSDAPLLSLEDIKYYAAIRRTSLDKRDIAAEPLSDDDYSGLPATVIFTAQCDPLCDDGRKYADNISDSGGQVQLFEEKGLVHGYLRARHSVTRARDSFDRIIKAISMLAKMQWNEN